VLFVAKVVPRVAAPAYPFGVVWLSVDGHRQFQGRVEAGYEVQIPAAFEAAGNHTVTATFEGTQYYGGSTSPPLEQHVNAGEPEPTTGPTSTSEAGTPGTGRDARVASTCDPGNRESLASRSVGRCPGFDPQLLWESTRSASVTSSATIVEAG
jgi:hypothetical protein